MKTNFKLFTTLLVVAILVISGCQSLEKMKKMANDVTLEATPNPVEMHGDSVEVKLTGSFPPKFFQKNAELEIKAVLRYEGGEKEFGSIKLQGEGVEANNKVISYTTGGSFEIIGKVAYEPAMRQAKVFAVGSATMKGETMAVIEREVIPGTMSTATLLDFTDGKVSKAGDNFQRTTFETKEAKVNFLINRYNLRGRELKKDEIVALNDYLKEIAAKENYELKDVTINAYASPDGTVEFNTKLVGNRQEVSEKYIAKQVKNAEIELADEQSIYNAMSTAEDWEGFKKLMEASNIQDKDLILRVLSMHSDPEVREQEIKNMAEAFEELKDEILPQLRRSEFKVKVAVIGFSDEELSKYVIEKPDTLDVEEMLFAATLTEDNEKLKTIYTTVTQKFSDDWRGHNNLGVINYLMGNFADAQASFEAAKEIEPNNSKVLNNLGATMLAQGDLEKAKDYLEAATAGGNEASYNQAMIATKQGKYDDAVDMYASSQFNTVNVALNKLLQYSVTKNVAAYDATLGILEKVENKENPLLYYVKAIVGARKQDSDMAFNNLRTAIEKNPDLKQTAATDIEFARYKDDATFQSIVQ